MRPEARAKFDSLLSEARQCLAQGNLDLALVALEKAHFIGQRFAVPHARVHLLMFRVNLNLKSLGEAAGQFLFIFVGFFGSLIGIVLAPNAGRFFVQDAVNKEVPQEIKELLGDKV